VSKHNVNIKFLVVPIIFLLLSNVGLLILYLSEKNKPIKTELYIPSLSEGDELYQFDLTDLKDGKLIKPLDGNNSSRMRLFCIFQEPCSPCNTNIRVWNVMAKVLKDKVNAYGIILNDLIGAKKILETYNIGFQLCTPEDTDIFKKSLNLKYNIPITILYDDRIRFLKYGEVTNRDFEEILKYLVEEED